VCAQLLVARAIRGLRRSRCLALAAGAWTAAWATVLLASVPGGGLAAAAGFCLAMVVFGLGETLLAPTLAPWFNELASDDLRGRYNGAAALASTSGYVVGPAAAGVLLGAGLGGPLIAGLAVACALLAVAALTLDRQPARLAAARPIPA
jgi:MFS family permease